MARKGYPGRMDTSPATSDWLRLDQQICFSLNAASRAFGSVYRVILKDLGITYPQYLVMLVLWEHGDLPVKSSASTCGSTRAPSPPPQATGDGRPRPARAQRP